MSFDRSIIEGLLEPVPTDTIAHYTRIGALCYFIPEGAAVPGWSSAWATPVQFLNDRQELSLGLKVFDKVAEELSVGLTLKAKIEELLVTNGNPEMDAFQMSFSANEDELGQWRGYAANGTGCSVVTSPSEVTRVADVAGMVVYDPANQREFARQVLTKLETENSPKVMEQTIVAAASYIKNCGFEPEKEFRLLKFPHPRSVKFRESGERLVPYVDYLTNEKPLPIYKIIVGPSWQLSQLAQDDSEAFRRNHVVQGIKRLLDARGLTSTIVDSSTIPYDPK